MSESTLSLDLSGLRSEVAYFLGKSRDASTWDENDLAIFDAHIRSGLRMFYNPLGHVWSFFKPFAMLLIASGTGSYALPDDFGFVIGDMIVADKNGTRRWPLRQVPMREIKLHERGKLGKPMYYATSPVAPSGNSGQRFQVSIFPVPDDEYTLHYQYSVVPHNISDEHPYPYGGEAHAETIKEAVLMKAEADTDDGSIGVHSNNYQERLAASIAYDRNLAVPDRLGYNGNGIRPCGFRRQMNMFVHGMEQGHFVHDQWVVESEEN